MKTRNMQFYFLLILLSVSTASLIWLFYDFITPIFFALLLNGIFAPFCSRISRSLTCSSRRSKGIRIFLHNNRETVAAALTVTAVVFLIVLPLIMTGFLFFNEAGSIYQELSGKIPDLDKLLKYIENQPYLKKVFSTFIPDSQTSISQIINTHLLPLLRNVSGSVFRHAASIFGNTVGIAINLFIMLLGLFYLLTTGNQLGHFIMRLSPLKSADEIKIYEMFKGIGRGVIVGNTVSALVQGLMSGIGFFIFSVPRPVFLAVLATFFAFIPFLGPFVICGPAAGYLFYLGRPIAGVFLLLYSLILVSSADNLIKPVFIGEQLNIHPFLILLSILGGLKLFGMMGIFYGPLTVTVFCTLAGIYLLEIESIGEEENAQ